MTLTIRLVVLLLLFLLSITVGSLSASPQTNAAKQVLKIVNNPDEYDREIYPKESGPVHVGINMFLREITIDDINMQMNVMVTLRMIWRDHRISYSEPGVQNIRLPNHKKFWIPDIFFLGVLRSEMMESIDPESYIQVDSRGNITFSSRMRLVVRCQMDFKQFPHDRQICPLELGSYGYPMQDISLNYHGESPVYLSRTVAMSNFILEEQTMDYSIRKSYSGEYSCLKIELQIHRIFSIYLRYWYVPCSMFVIVSFFSLLLSVDVLLPRLVLTLAPLLVVATSSLSNSKSLPSTPYSTPLDIYSGMSLITIFLTCLQVVIGYWFANRDKSQEEHEDLSDDKGKSKLQMIKSKLMEKGEFWSRILLVAFYIIFIFFYFVAYCT